MTDKETIQTWVIEGQADKIIKLCATYLHEGDALNQGQMTWLHNCINKRGVDYVMAKVIEQIKEDK